MENETVRALKNSLRGDLEWLAAGLGNTHRVVMITLAQTHMDNSPAGIKHSFSRINGRAHATAKVHVYTGHKLTVQQAPWGWCRVRLLL